GPGRSANRLYRVAARSTGRQYRPLQPRDAAERLRASEQEQHHQLDAVHHAVDGRSRREAELGPAAAERRTAPLQLVHATPHLAVQLARVLRRFESPADVA